MTMEQYQKNTENLTITGLGHEKPFDFKVISGWKTQEVSCFSNGVIRGKQDELKAVLREIGHEDVRLVQTSNPDIFEADLMNCFNYNDGHLYLLDIIKQHPSLKVTGFLEDWSSARSVWILYSEAGYPYVTEGKIAGVFDLDSGYPWQWEFHPTKDFNTSFAFLQTGEEVVVNYRFPYRRKWEDSTSFSNPSADEYQATGAVNLSPQNGIRLTEEINFLNFKNRSFVLTGFDSSERIIVKRQIERHGGTVRNEINGNTYCVVVNDENYIPESTNDAVDYCKKGCIPGDSSFTYHIPYIIGRRTLKEFLPLPEGTLLDPDQPAYTIGENILFDVSAAATELDLSGERLEGIVEQAFYSCARLKKITLSYGDTIAHRLKFTPVEELRFTVPVPGIKKGWFDDKPIPALTLPLTTLKDYKDTLGVRGVIDSYIHAQQEDLDIVPALKEEYDNYLRSNWKKYVDNDAALSYMAKQNLIPPKNIAAVVKQLQDRGNHELAAELEKSVEGAERIKAEKAPTSSEEKLWSTKKRPDGTLQLMVYKGLATDIVFPTELKGLPVTAVHARALSPDAKGLTEEQQIARRKIKTVVIPEGILDIGIGGTCLLSDIEALEKVQFPSTLQRSCGFGGIKDTTEVLLPETYYSCVNAFSSSTCDAIHVPSNVQLIPDGFISYNKQLKEIIIPEGVERIGFGAFDYCSSLETVSIPDSVTEIGQRAFGDCLGLKSVVLPKNLKKIDSNVFSRCKKLVSVSLPDALEYIYPDAFYSCESLESITLPKNVIMVDDAFTWCDNLKTVKVLGKKTQFADRALRSLASNGGTLVAPTGSFAEKYAKANGIRFEKL